MDRFWQRCSGDDVWVLLSFLAFVQDDFQHGLDLSTHLAVGEPDHANPLFRQPGRSFRVVLGLFGVRVAVDVQSASPSMASLASAQ